MGYFLEKKAQKFFHRLLRQNHFPLLPNHKTGRGGRSQTKSVTAKIPQAYSPPGGEELRPLNRGVVQPQGNWWLQGAKIGQNLTFFSQDTRFDQKMTPSPTMASKSIFGPSSPGYGLFLVQLAVQTQGNW